MLSVVSQGLAQAREDAKKVNDIGLVLRRAPRKADESFMAQELILRSMKDRQENLVRKVERITETVEEDLATIYRTLSQMTNLASTPPTVKEATASAPEADRKNLTVRTIDKKDGLKTDKKAKSKTIEEFKAYMDADLLTYDVVSALIFDLQAEPQLIKRYKLDKAIASAQRHVTKIERLESKPIKMNSFSSNNMEYEKENAARNMANSLVNSLSKARSSAWVRLLAVDKVESGGSGKTIAIQIQALIELIRPESLRGSPGFFTALFKGDAKGKTALTIGPIAKPIRELSVALRRQVSSLSMLKNQFSSYRSSEL